ncbi:MAG: BREX system ATP-binding domain-containing protein [Acetobacteraceae bacterium]
MEDLTPTPLPAADWLRVIESEYLTEFLPAGGAALRIAVMPTHAIPAMPGRLAALARAHGMHPVAIDAATTRLHMPQDVFFALARALPWPAMTQSFLEALCESNGYPWPRPGQSLSRAALAAALEIAPPLLNSQLNTWLTRAIWRDRAYAQDFRAALLALAAGALDGDTAAASAARAWLAGEKAPPASLRAAGIGGRINRANARAMLIGLCHWVRAAGATGLLVSLDARRLHQPGPAPEGSLRYSPAAVMDTYEVLRELIDDAEHLPGLLVVVLADSAMIGGEPRRALDQYDALRMRVWPDVRPGEGQNPVAPLVWVSLWVSP